MKKTRLVLFLPLTFIAFFLLSFEFTTPVYADMMPATPQQAAFLIGYSLVGLLIMFFIVPAASSFIEAYTAGLFLGTAGNNLVKSFIKINFISYYPALILLGLIGNIMPNNLQRIVPLLIAELFVVFLEYFLIKWQFNKLTSKLILKMQIDNFQILKTSLLVNLASALLGIILVALLAKIPLRLPARLF